MDSIEELNKIAHRIIGITTEIGDSLNEEIVDKAPIIVHRRLCGIFTDHCRQNAGKKIEEIPEALKVLSAIEVLGAIYPKLNEE